MHVGIYLKLVRHSELQLSHALMTVASHHGDEPDITQICKLLAAWSRANVESLNPLLERYASEKSDEPERLTQGLFKEPRTGSLALLQDLHDLWLLAMEVQLYWIILLQAAKALRDKELEETCVSSSGQTKRQVAWLMSCIQQAAPQALVVG